MAFDTPTRQAQYQAINLLDQIRGMYQMGKSAQGNLTLYQAGSNPAFNEAVDGLHDAAERSTLGTMLTQINALVSNWEADNAKRAALGLPPL